NIQNLGSFYTGLSFRDKAHDYYTQRDKLSMLSFRGTLNGFDPFYATYYYNLSIDGSGEASKGFALNYNHQCFTFTAMVDKDEGDTSVLFSITFAGFTLK
ncbi:MAG: hypothetical protein LBV76_01470, partial [Deltaproteobacteria bacterium]|nr:hypothetical protein [Deltaproteobacteria bacterium]